MRIGYARVSTHEQNLDLQKDALEKAGCKKIFVDKVSGVAADRPGIEETLSHLREGDTLVVWRLDRLGRSLKNLIQLISRLEEMKVGFQSLHESMDTTSSGGKLVFHIFGALAEFERNLIRERTQAGLAAASTLSQWLSQGISSSWPLSKPYHEMLISFTLVSHTNPGVSSIKGCPAGLTY